MSPKNFICSLLVLLVVVFVATLTEARALPTVDVDLSKYDGRWYQVASNLFVSTIIERFGSCVTADYGINSDGSISVKNSQKDLFGRRSSVSGTARPDGEPGKFIVTFTFGRSGNYWIVALGPETSEGKYAYSIVTDDNATTLFVLARSVSDYESIYKPEISAKLRELRFTGLLGRPIPTRQRGCSY